MLTLLILILLFVQDCDTHSQVHQAEYCLVAEEQIDQNTLPLPSGRCTVYTRFYYKKKFTLQSQEYHRIRWFPPGGT